MDIEIIVMILITLITVDSKQESFPKIKEQGKQLTEVVGLVSNSLAIKHLWSHLCVKTTYKQGTQ